MGRIPTISKSDTSSEVELDALIKQIKGIMATDQLQAIETMDLTHQSVSEMVQSQGISARTSVFISTPGGSKISLAGPGGGPDGMPGGGDGDSVMSAIEGGMTTEIMPAATQLPSTTVTIQGDSMVLNTLIQMLKTKSLTNG